MSTTIQFKRGTATRWNELNLVLQAGEPGYVIDENRFKIGDGSTAWNDLPYIGENEVFNAQTHYDFPSVGKVNTIYKAESEQQVYQWNSTKLAYEPLNVGSGSILDINLINGGNANGNS